MKRTVVILLLALLVVAPGTVNAAQLIDVGALLGDDEFQPWDLAVLPDGTVRFLGSYAGNPRIVDINPTAATPLIGYTDFAGLMAGEGATAYAISPNGQWIAGVGKSSTSDPIALGQGVLWSTAEPQIPVALDYAPSSPMNEGKAFTVADSGAAAGVSGGTATVWSTGGGVQELTALGGLTWNAQIFGTNAEGTKHVGSSTNADWMLVATLWDLGSPIALEDPYSWNSNAYGISPDGNFITGAIDTGGVEFGLALWDGEGTLLDFVTTYADGTPVAATGFEVSNTGVVVGSDGLLPPDSTGLIFKPGWDGVQTLQSWAMNEFGIDLGNSFKGEGIVSFNGFDYIASYGSAKLLITESDIPPEPVPEPASVTLLGIGIAFAGEKLRRMRAQSAP